MYKELFKKVKHDGFAILDKGFDLDFCNEVISFIDNFNELEAELCYGGTEVRIWDAHKKSEHIRIFKEESDKLLTRMYGKPIESYTVLALKNSPIPDLESLRRGRWYIDSFREQVKVFTFLSEVKEVNGPFEFITGSHKAIFKLKNVLKGNYFALTDLFGNKRKYQNLEQNFIVETISKNTTVPILCKPGTTAVIDTSSIHRARPCSQGSRYYLAAYYNHF